MRRLIVLIFFILYLCLPFKAFSRDVDELKGLFFNHDELVTWWVASRRCKEKRNWSNEFVLNKTLTDSQVILMAKSHWLINSNKTEVKTFTKNEKSIDGVFEYIFVKRGKIIR